MVGGSSGHVSSYEAEAPRDRPALEVVLLKHSGPTLLDLREERDRVVGGDKHEMTLEGSRDVGPALASAMDAPSEPRHDRSGTHSLDGSRATSDPRSGQAPMN